MSDSPTFEAWECPECGNIQNDKDDCISCGFGDEEEGWDSVTAYENAAGEFIKVE